MYDRQSEADQYAKDYESDWYGMGEARQKDVCTLLAAYRCDSLLDVSTGRGEALSMADSLGYPVALGTETVEALCNDRVTHAYSITLPFSDGAFELVTCFDVLEHLIDEDIAPSLREFVRVSSGKVIVSANERSFVYNGREQHISKRPASEWESTIIDALPGCTVKRIDNAGDSPCWVIHA
jgi:ubiquinone/menaquinone biosynthesis C-methylase UbiE